LRASSRKFSSRSDIGDGRKPRSEPPPPPAFTDPFDADPHEQAPEDDDARLHMLDDSQLLAFPPIAGNDVWGYGKKWDRTYYSY
jgi:hypothetical protein